MKLASLILLGVALAAALVCSRGKVLGTTLMAGWWWSLCSLAAIITVELLALAGSGGTQSQGIEHARFFAAVTTFAPTMALLGAKRPQHRAWQFIVASLLIVLWLPGFEAILYRPGAPLELHTTRRWFMLLLMLVALFNGLPARDWPSSVLYFLAQACLLGPYLPLAEYAEMRAMPLVGLTLWAAAAGLRASGLPRRPNGQAAFDRLWLDFRDTYGMLWGLRVCERWNATAKAGDWNVRLRWAGLADASGQPPHRLDPKERDAALRQLGSLLQRFVSRSWIAERLGDSLD